MATVAMAGMLIEPLVDEDRRHVRAGDGSGGSRIGAGVSTCRA
jgi:hypothetical protein